MAEYDVMIYWNHGPVPDSIMGLFKRPTKFINLGTPTAVVGGNLNFTSDVEKYGWPHPIRTILQQRMGSDRALRVGLLGFSASVNGVRKLLSSADGLLVDTAVAIDGITCEKVDSALVRGAYLGAFTAMGRIAAFGPAPQQAGAPCYGGKCLVITNSQAAATTPQMETADVCSAEIAYKVLGSEPFATQPLPDRMLSDTVYHPWTNPAGTITWPNGSKTSFAEHTYVMPPNLKAYDYVGDFVVLRYNNVDPTSIGDHRYQGRVVLRQVLEAFVVPRWNRLSPTQGTCVVV
jgi:hypothetical protein